MHIWEVNFLSIFKQKFLNYFLDYVWRHEVVFVVFMIMKSDNKALNLSFSDVSRCTVISNFNLNYCWNYFDHLRYLAIQHNTVLRQLYTKSLPKCEMVSVLRNFFFIQILPLNKDSKKSADIHIKFISTAPNML